MRPKPVEVTWVDTQAKGGWRTPEVERERSETMLATSVGYLLHRDKGRIVLVQSHSPETEHGEELVADSLTIPASAVQKVRPLR
jgi:hypothetical protein